MSKKGKIQKKSGRNKEKQAENNKRLLGQQKKSVEK